MSNGQMVGEYELREELGSGSFGTVWKAKHRSADSWRAIKIAKDPALVTQFRTEFEVLDRLDHRHIVRVYDLVTSGEVPAIIFEYVEGQDLEKLLGEQGQLPWRQAVEIAAQVLDGLAVAHEAELLHRDIKPSNILLTRDGQVKIADFGLVSAAERSGSVEWSQRSGTSHVAGTVHYMAPEVEERGQALPQSDLYSLGVVLYRCLTGRLPRGLARPASSYGAPGALDAVLASLLDPEVEARPATAGGALGDLQQAVREAQGEERAAAEVAAQAEAARLADEARRQEEQHQSEAADRRQRELAERQQQAEEERRQAEAQHQREKEKERQRLAAAEQQRQEEVRRRRAAEMPPTVPSTPEVTPAPPSRTKWVVPTAVAAAVLLFLVIVISVSMHQQSPGAAVPSRTPAVRSGERAGETWTGPDGGTMVWVPPGEFMMGSNHGEANEKPIHQVQIMNGYWLGKCQVTNAQYRAFCAVTGRVFPTASTRGDDHPVVCVSWDDAQAYCQKYGLSLPTEAQWEYAARGAEGRTYPWGNDWDPGKCCSDENRGPGGQTYPVGSFPAGASWCGVLDLAGNVWEWCADWYDEGYYQQSPTVDPLGPSSRQYRVLRGGSWGVSPSGCRSAGRINNGPTNRFVSGGFRVARTP